MNMLSSGLIAFILGSSGLGCGSIMVYLFTNRYREIIPFLILISSGMLFSLITFSMYPESMNLAGFWPPVIGIMLSVAFMNRFEKFSRRIIIFTASPQNDIFLKSGVLLSIAVGLHNIPTGIAFGTSLAGDYRLATTLGIAIFVHSIPEGIIISIPFALYGLGLLGLPVLILFAGLPMAFSAILGHVFGQVGSWLQGMILGCSIGTICFVTIHEMVLPVWKQIHFRISLLCVTVGALAGSLFVFIE